MQFARAGTGEFHTGIELPPMGVIASAELIADVEAAVKGGSLDRRVRMLRRMADLFLSDAARLNRHQVRIFDDVLVRLIERTETQALAQLSTGLAELASAPQETVRHLARHDDATVAGPLLEKSRSLADGDLQEIANNCSQRHLLALSRRRPLTETLTDVILKRAGQAALRVLAGNSGARISEKGHLLLAAGAEQDDRIAELMVLRADLPAAILRQLLSTKTETVRIRLLNATPAPLRETIQATIDSIAVPEAEKTAGPVDYADALTMVDALNRIGKLNDSAVNRFAVRGERTNLTAALSVLSGANIESIEPLLDDNGCEGLVIACRASRLNWQTTLAVINNRSVPRISKQELEQAKERFETLYVSTAQYTIRFEPPGRSAPPPRAVDDAFATAGGGR